MVSFASFPLIFKLFETFKLKYFLSQSFSSSFVLLFELWLHLGRNQCFVGLVLAPMDMPVISSESVGGRDKLLKLAEVSPNSKSVPKQKKQTVKSVKHKNQSSRIGSASSSSSSSNNSNNNNNGQHDLSFTSNIEHLVARSSTPISSRVASIGENVSSEFVGNYICASHPSSRNGSPTKIQSSVGGVESPGHQTVQHQSHIQQQQQQMRRQLGQQYGCQTQQPPVPALFSTSLTESGFGLTTTGNVLEKNAAEALSPSDLMFSSLKIDDANRNHGGGHSLHHQSQHSHLQASSSSSHQASVVYQSHSAGKTNVHPNSRIPNLCSSTSTSNPRLLHDFGKLNRWPETEDLSKHSSHRRLFVDDENPTTVSNPCSTTNPTNPAYTNAPTNIASTNISCSRIPVFHTGNSSSCVRAVLAKSHSVHQQIHHHHHQHHSNTSNVAYSTGIQRSDAVQQHASTNPFSFSGHHNPFDNLGFRSRLSKSKTNDSFVSHLEQNSASNFVSNSSRILDFNSPSTAVRVFENNQFDPTWFPVISTPNGVDPAPSTHMSAPNGSSVMSTPPNVRDAWSNSSNRRISTPLRPTQSNDECLSPAGGSLGISTPDQSLYEKFFLRETQKNVLAAINHNQKLNRSASCESFELFQQQTLAETRMLNADAGCSSGSGGAGDQKRNELNGLSHLEEGPREDESILNRFRKSFSLRFSKSNERNIKVGVDGTHSTMLNDNGFMSRGPEHSAVASADGTGSAVDESRKSQTETRDGDINQNTIFRPSANTESNFVRVATIERRKSRHDPFGRKSLRRSSKKSFRLKRSSSQPTDKLLDGSCAAAGTRSPNDLSFDSSDVESCKSPNMLNETCSTTDLNDSHEVSPHSIQSGNISDSN